VIVVGGTMGDWVAAGAVIGVVTAAAGLVGAADGEERETRYQVPLLSTTPWPVV
jgi:hypothetical protein